MILRNITFATTIVLGGIPAGANEFAPMLEELAKGEIRGILEDERILEAIRAQNERTAKLSQTDIEELDNRWRSEIGAAEHPLIDSVTSGAVAEILRTARSESGGLFTEIFLMDGVGLNVAASDVTSDYWQGDEAKWLRTVPTGSGTLHIGDVELDASTQTYQSQISVAILDPDTQATIGAATFGVNLELIQ